MSTSFKRVISHPEELGNLSKKISMGPKESNKNSEEQDRKPPAVTTSAPTPAVVIESEEGPPSPECFRGISTLSDDDESVDLEKDEVGDLQREDEATTLQESPSAARTQRAHSGSSGTFGWFIDVQGGESEVAIGMESETPRSGRSINEANDTEDDFEEITQYIDISQQAVGSGEF